ncbi:hypothetical protein [Paraburkholderia aromaticivorans]|uniref:hypothetical protein n=1 Tax=Paraburkholderia aromaticivorans TaxID=2026199 RepID=UPI0014560FE5|nr:hypothetical protein [Paraburkholderia aromaticivorans]
MNSTQLLKFAAAVLLFGAWLALVVIGKAPADQLIGAIALTITGLGIHGATMSTPGVTLSGGASSAEAFLQPAVIDPPAVAVSSPAATAPAATAQASAATPATLQ